ncbi:hypothetical protein AVM02_18555 [Brucella anthropi]
MKLMKRGYEIPSFPHVIRVLLEPEFLGVDIFFILSGIVISKSAVGRSWDDFARARFIRLFPAYFIATVIGIILASFTMSVHPPVPQLLMSLTGLQWFYGYPTIIGPAWTLFFEVRFYILIAVFVATMRLVTTDSMRTFAIIWSISLILAPSLNIPAFNFLVISDYGVYFCFGIILGTTTNNSVKSNVPLIIFGFSIAWVRLQARYGAIEHHAFEAEIVSALILLAITFVALRPHELSFIRSEKSYRLVTNLALATYPLYLLHEPVGMPLIAELTRLGAPFSLSFLLVLVLITAFSLYCATKLEKRFGRFILRYIFGVSPDRTKTV